MGLMAINLCGFSLVPVNNTIEVGINNSSLSYFDNSGKIWRELLVPEKK
jgi:hypothetical protein